MSVEISFAFALVSGFLFLYYSFYFSPSWFISSLRWQTCSVDCRGPGAWVVSCLTPRLSAEFLLMPSHLMTVGLDIEFQVGDHFASDSKGIAPLLSHFQCSGKVRSHSDDLIL